MITRSFSSEAEAYPLDHREAGEATTVGREDGARRAETRAAEARDNKRLAIMASFLSEEQR